MKIILLRLALLGALVFAGAQAVSAETFSFQAGDVRVQTVPALPGGRLTLPLGPIGDLTWTTHTGPLNLEVQFFLGGGAGELPTVEEFQDLRLAFLLRKLPWLFALGLLGGVLITEGAWRRRLRGGAVGIGVLLGAVAIAGTIAGLTFDANRLADPRYRGPIADAPRVLELIRDVQRDWAGVHRNINEAVAVLQRLHEQVVTEAPAPSAETVRLLLIADIHNNPLGMLIARELIERFDVDGLLNAGDFTDMGTSFEGEMFARFADLGIPHVIAPGNHEDRDTLDIVRELPDVTILGSEEESLAEIMGVTITGEADSNAYFITSDPHNDLARERDPILCAALRARWLRHRTHVVLVHSPRVGECVAEEAVRQGAVLVYAWGHMHSPAYDIRGGTVISVSPGTSGADRFRREGGVPYGFALLDFDAESLEPVSVCQFLFDSPGILDQTTCHLVGGRLTPAEAADEPDPAEDPTPEPAREASPEVTP